MSNARILKSVISITVILAVILIAGIWHLGNNPMIACGFLGAFFIYIGSRKVRWMPTLLTGLVAGLIYKALGGPFHGYLGYGAFLGIGSIVVMSLDRVWNEANNPLMDALILPIFSLIAGVTMQFSNGGTHQSYDYLLYNFDTSIGVTPGLSIQTLFRNIPWIGTGASLIYSSLLIFPPLFHGLALYKGKNTANLMQMFVIAGVGGFLLYQICPGMGPIYTFGANFPYNLPNSVPATGFLSTGVNNAMPSMHMTWALLVWVAAWELGPVAVAVASVFALFTGFATVGFGEHYLIDLIVAVPLVMLVRGIATKRIILVVTGIVLTVSWTTFLRTGLLPPAYVSWFCIAETVLGSAYLIFSKPVPYKTTVTQAVTA